MGTLIDSSILIARERQVLDLGAAMTAHADEPVGIAAITASELLHGVARAATALAVGYRVATRDKRGFRSIPGLELVVL